ncbi:MAG: hypothetical protein ABF535_08510 [Acetobacter sp.]
MTQTRRNRVVPLLSTPKAAGAVTGRLERAAAGLAADLWAGQQTG